MIVTNRICRQCNCSKQLEEFKKHSRNPSGYDTICLDCHSDNDRAFQKTPRGKALMMWRAYNYKARKNNIEVNVTKEKWLEFAIPRLALQFDSKGLYINNLCNTSCSMPTVSSLTIEETLEIDGKKEQKQEKVTDSILDEVRERKKDILSQFAPAKKAEILEGFLYIIRNSVWPEALKIGKSSDYEQRNEDYQVYDPYQNYRRCHTSRRFDDVSAAEKMLKTILSPRKISGEWYKISISELINVFNWMETKSNIK